MSAIAGRRTLHTRPGPGTSSRLTRCIARTSFAGSKGFQTTSRRTGTRNAWMPMRVKTPWIEALTQSREASRQLEDGNTTAAAQPAKADVTPKKMSDSYYSAV